MRVGVLHLDLAAPLEEGLALGFGSEQFPVYCFTEQTYESGFTSYITESQQRFRAMGARVVFVPGLFQSKFPPDQLAGQLYFCARASAGYWIYTMQTLATPNYQPLGWGAPRQYWEAIARANRELDHLADDPAYLSNLIARPNAPVGPPIPWGGFVHYEVLAPTAKVVGGMPSLWLRRANWLYFWARKGEAINFELTWRQLGTYPEVMSAGLVSPRWEPLTAATARPNEPAIIQFAATEDGLYGLVLQDGFNAVEVTRASHPFSVQASAAGDGAFLTVRVPPLFLAILPGASRAVIELTTPVTAQAVKATLTADDGSLLWSAVVDGVARVSIDAPRGAYVRIDATKLAGRVLQDFHVNAVEGVVPLVAFEPTWLLRPVK